MLNTSDENVKAYLLAAERANITVPEKTAMFVIHLCPPWCKIEIVT
jgi:hypothetical protein